MKKRGQVTVFIILGIFILMATILIFYYINRTYFTPDVVVPQQVAPIKNYVESCIYDVGKEAIIIMGIQSGYVEIPEEISMDSDAYILVGGSVKTPYWYLNGEDISPTMEDMQSQISDYVYKNMKNCLKNFSGIDEFIIEEKDNITVETSIAEEEVVIKLDYTLIIKNRKGDRITEWSLYSNSVPVRLRRIYRLAKNLMNAENKDMFFERKTIDLMALDPEIPFTDMEFSCTNLEWSKTEIKNTVQELLYYNLPKIRIDRTDYIPFLYPDSVYKEFQSINIEKDPIPENIPDDLYEYNQFFWKPLSESFNDMKVGVRYMKDWSMQLEANPSNGDLMSSNMFEGDSEYLSMFCINLYHFTYDIVYPVEIAIRDEKSFNGEGYVFRYAFPVLIKQNSPDRSDFDITKLDTYVDAGFCNDLTEEEYIIQVRDARTQLEIDNASIIFECVKYKCNLGFTEADANSYRLKTKIPSSCVNGIVKASKEGYLKQEKQIDEKNVLIEMEPLKKFDFQVMKVDESGQKSLASDETAAIYIKSVKKDYNIFALYPKEEGMKYIELINNNADYSIEIFLMKGNDLIGGYKADWNIEYNDINGKNMIIFYAYDFGKAETNDKKIEMVSFLNKNKNNVDLIPKFS
ncbi:MAG: hypothetical protein PHV16_00480 [Candidatus Nanoarchaeia archaeon]|nr:hypothetical protein [Candidatus Nanoarchaeia archaeon]